MSMRTLLQVSTMLLVASGASSAVPRPTEDQWKPIDAAHLALKSPSVEKDADAEAIFYEIKVEKQIDEPVILHYVRIKVFTERGRESQSKVELPYWNNRQVKDIAARTIKPNGAIVDLRPDAILDTTVAQAKKFKLRAKAFTFPGVEPGDLIEYRWREVLGKTSYLPIHFQLEIPAQTVRCGFTTKRNPDVEREVRTFNLPGQRFTPAGDGFTYLTLSNVPAYRREPQMPPENEARMWLLAFNRYYALPYRPFWTQIGTYLYETTKPYLKVTDDLRNALTMAVGDASTPEGKLERIFEFCRSKIKNVNDDASGMTEDKLAKLKTNKSPTDTLKRGMGTGSDINMLFAALAATAGFEARYSSASDRSQIFFDQSLEDVYFLTASEVAVRVGDRWRFFDPASTHVPYGMLRWQEEGVDALVADPLNKVFVRTPISPPEKSCYKRTADFRLNEEGLLEGDVKIEYTGHVSAEVRETYDQDTPEAREKALRESITGQFSTAEVSNLKVENIEEASKPLIVSYHIRVAGYAQRTGKRLFLQPAFFQHGSKPLFSASERRHPIYFHFPWSENDTVIIDLPQGFELDNAEKPSPFSAAGVSTYEVRLGIDPVHNSLFYNRNFVFGMGGNLLFPARGSNVPVEKVYPQVKLLFDALHERDSHTITLKQNAPAPK